MPGMIRKNPVPGPDTGRSVITDGRVEITIDYEVVDLEFLDPEYYPTRSPMAFIDPTTGLPAYMYSDRYCFLQTYTICNVDPNSQPLTGLEFYQMLHSHGADEYGPAVSSTYATIAPEDALQYYVPYNPVHQVGNFRYDVTQWNDIDRTGATTGQTHNDYVGFSSTREPDWVDNDVYRGHRSPNTIYKPPAGTHLHIEDRLLNGNPAIYYDEVAGAMGWSLGALNSNETVSITVAFMFGQEQEPITAPVELVKMDDLPPETEVRPGDEITYTICWENLSQDAAQDVVLVDYLPEGVTYPGGSWSFDPNFTPIPPEPGYDPGFHSYTWELGTIEPSGTGCVQITVMVNDRAEPGLVLENKARLVTSNMGAVQVHWLTPVACWAEGPIHVDARATGKNTGVSWQDAYTDLQRALARAAAGCGAEIHIAAGTYRPGRDTQDTFRIPDGVSVYGGYRGGRTNPDGRDIRRYKTILTGLINPTTRNDTVVTMGDNTLLDGVIVEQGEQRGVYVVGASIDIQDCTVRRITGIGGIGVEVEGSVVSARRLRAIENVDGLYAKAGSLLVLENSLILNNAHYGVRALESGLTLTNSVVARNGLAGSGYYGLSIALPSQIPDIHNNTVVHNRNEGLFFFDSDPNNPKSPDIQSCILWYNNAGGRQMAGCGFRRYSCVYDPNDPTGQDYTPDVYGNFSGNPRFAYADCTDPNALLNVHLAADSPCINAGNPALSYEGQRDIDNEGRVLGGRVDIGADEVDPACADVFSALDWNADGVVNLHEFNFFSRAWLTTDPNNPICDPNHPGYVSDPNALGYVSETDKLRFDAKCDLDADLDVDLEDLALFLEHWLWQACWRRVSGGMFPLSMDAGGQTLEALAGADAASLTLEGDFAVAYEPWDLSRRAALAQILAFLKDIEPDYPDPERLRLLQECLIEEAKILREPNVGLDLPKQF